MRFILTVYKIIWQLPPNIYIYIYYRILQKLNTKNVHMTSHSDLYVLFETFLFLVIINVWRNARKCLFTYLFT